MPIHNAQHVSSVTLSAGEPSGRAPLLQPRRRGSALIYATILVPVLMLILSLAIDFGYVTCVRGELQAVVDAASLAGSSGLAISPAEARSRAKATALLNKVGGVPLVLTDNDIQLGTWNESTQTFTALTGSSEATASAVRVTGTLSAARGSPVRLFMLPAVEPGNGSVDLTRSSVATAQRTAADIVIVQDVSGSFSQEISYARAGDRDLLVSMNQPGSKANFGLVAFTGEAKTLATLKSVASNYYGLRFAVEMLSVGGYGMPSTSSGTDIAAGMEAAQSLFDGFNSGNSNRCMIIVSDGEPRSNYQGAHPSLSDSQLLTLAQTDADKAYAKGIQVYVVFWDSANDATAAANLKSLVRGKGEFVHVSDPSQLSGAIATVLTRSQALVK